jgi:hypothetical protein
VLYKQVKKLAERVKINIFSLFYSEEWVVNAVNGLSFNDVDHITLTWTSQNQKGKSQSKNMM